MRLRRITIATAAVLGLVASHSCSFFTNPYKHIDSELLQYLGTGRVGVAYDVQVKDGLAYVANNDGVVVVDVSRPQSGDFARVGEINVGTASFGLDISDSRIFLGGGSGLVIADITQPANPQIVGSYELNSTLSQVRIREHHAFLATREDGLIILDVGNPGVPTLVGRHDNGGVGSAVEIVGDLVFFADVQDGLEVITS